MNFRRKIKAARTPPASRRVVVGSLGGAALILCANAFAATNGTGNANINGAIANTNSNQAAPKVAIVSTTRPGSASRQASQTSQTDQTFATLQATAAAPSAANAPVLVASAQTIYKLVDAQGRTTYANSPMVGAQKIALPDLTIMDSQWPSGLAGAAGTATASNPAPTKPTATPLPAPISQTANPQIGRASCRERVYCVV